nr:reverse transcriptase domain-containing protein [Tanacetum cinerariifolium]
MSTRSSARNLFLPLDILELTIRRRSRTDPTLLNDFEMAAEGNGDPPVPDLWIMEELCQPSLNGRGGPIAPISIQAMNFRLKNDMIQQASCSFSHSSTSILSFPNLSFLLDSSPPSYFLIFIGFEILVNKTPSSRTLIHLTHKIKLRFFGGEHFEADYVGAMITRIELKSCKMKTLLKKYNPFDAWKALIEDLGVNLIEELGINIISFDRPGYGESDPGPKRT